MNNNNNSLNPKQMNALLKEASQKLGTNPNTLKNELENGNLNNIMKNMTPAQSQALNNILSDPNALKKMLNTPQAKNLMNKFMGGVK